MRSNCLHSLLQLSNHWVPSLITRWPTIGLSGCYSYGCVSVGHHDLKEGEWRSDEATKRKPTKKGGKNPLGVAGRFCCLINYFCWLSSVAFEPVTVGIALSCTVHSERATLIRSPVIFTTKPRGAFVVQRGSRIEYIQVLRAADNKKREKNPGGGGSFCCSTQSYYSC